MRSPFVVVLPRTLLLATLFVALAPQQALPAAIDPIDAPSRQTVAPSQITSAIRAIIRSRCCAFSASRPA